MMTKKISYINSHGKEIVFSPENGIFVKAVDGFTNTDIEITINRGINQYGGVVTGASVPERQITIEGLIAGESENTKQEMIEVIEPLIGGYLIAYDKWRIEVYPTQTPAFSLTHEFSDFQLSFIAPFPYWETVNSFSVPLAGIFPKFKFPWNLTKKWQFGNKVNSYFINVPNYGPVDIPYTVNIRALDTATNFSLLNVQTQEKLNIAITLQQDEILTITNTHNRIEAHSTVQDNVSGLIDLDSTLYRLHSGDNILRYDADTGRDKLEVVVEGRVETPGVVL